MSTLLEQASLVMIPSGYKEDVVYSQIPTSGAGDLSFTRASNGTRINSAGLVEVCPWNLVQNSENFDAVWTKYNGATVTTDAIVAPNGTTTADLLIAGASQEVYSANMPKVAEELYYTFSCYAKLYNTNVFKMTASDFSTSGVDASFNLSTLSATYVTGATWSNSSASIESVGNGWYRCILTSKSPATTGLYLSLYTSGTNSVSGVYIWGAQTNIGSTAKPYFPTTDRLNVPRLTYQNGGGGCPSLLLEKQSTNYAQYSEDFSNGFWTKDTTTTLTANDGISPDGTQNADRFESPSSAKGIYSYGVSGSETISVYIKAGNSGNVGKSAVLFTTTATQDFILTNDWQRISVSGAASSLWALYPSATNSFTNVLIWGAQAEGGSYPTSLINTTSSSATRVADACYKTGISSLIGQTEGVVFWQGQISDVTGGELCDLNANGDKFIQIYNTLVGSTPTIGLYIQNVSVLLNNSNIATIAYNTNFKFALAYKNNDYVAYLNGVQVYVNTTIGVPATSNFSIGAYNQGDVTANKSTNQVVLFKTRLTNAELASLTTI